MALKILIKILINCKPYEPKQNVLGAIFPKMTVYELSVKRGKNHPSPFFVVLKTVTSYYGEMWRWLAQTCVWDRKSKLLRFKNSWQRTKNNLFPLLKALFYLIIHSLKKQLWHKWTNLRTYVYILKTTTLIQNLRFDSQIQ